METTSVEVCYERIGFHIDKHNCTVVSLLYYESQRTDIIIHSHHFLVTQNIQCIDVQAFRVQLTFSNSTSQFFSTFSYR